MPPKVLIVDNDRYTRRVIETLIARDAEISALAPLVFTADEPAAALQIFDRERPDVVVVDLLAPPTVGVELCRTLRGKSSRELPILAMSALYKDQKLLDELKRDLRVEFFAKPLQVRDLVRAVREALQNVEEEHEPSVKTFIPDGGASGALAERPVPLLLFDYLEQKATGTLSVQRGRMRKDIYLDGGQPIGVRSNLRRETLSAFLTAKHLLDSHQVDAATALSQKSRVRLGQALVQLGYMNDAEVMQHLTSHVKLKLINCLRWRDGMWEFRPGVAEHISRTPLDPVLTVLRGLRKSARPDAIAAEFESHEMLRLIPTPRVEDYGAIFRREFGASAIDLLSDQPNIGGMLRKGNPIELLPALDALVACGLAVLDPPPLVMPAPAPARARRRSIPATSDPLSLGNLRTGASRPPRAAQMDELFGEDELPGDPTDPDQRIEVVTDVRKTVLGLYLALPSRTYYELLGVDETDTPGDVAVAYERLTEEWRRYQGAALGDERPKLLEILLVMRRAFETLTDAKLRDAYDQSLAVAPAAAKHDAFHAEQVFRAGEDLLHAGSYDQAANKFAEAIALRADQAEFHALLGWARFLALGAEGVGEARQQLEQALQIDPDLTLAHEYLGRIGLELATVPADFRKAALHLGRALDLDPTRREAIDALERSYQAIDAHADLERQYRKLIHDLDGRERELSAALWKKLATLYADRMADAKSALFAFDVAATLAPDDASIVDRVVALAALVPEQWPVAARALRAKWRNVAEQSASSSAAMGAARQLMVLHLDGGRASAAARVAQAMRAQGVTDPDVQATASLQVSRGLSPPRPLDEATLGRIRAEGDDPALGKLFALLGPVGRAIRPIALEDLGILPQHRLVPPPALAEAIGRAQAMLGMTRAIEVYEHPGGSDDVRAALADPPILAAGPRALTSSDLPALKFRVARAASYLVHPERVLALAWPAKRIKALLLGAVSAVGRKVDQQELERDVGRVRARVALEPEPILRALRERVALVAGDPAQLDVSAWMTAVSRTADRLGLLCCDDLTASLRCLRGDPAALAALLDWSLSDEYARLREALYEGEERVEKAAWSGSSPIEDLVLRR